MAKRPVLPRRMPHDKRSTTLIAAGPAQLIFGHYETPRRERETRILVRHEEEAFFLFPDGSYDKRAAPIAAGFREQLNQMIGAKLPENRIAELEDEITKLREEVHTLAALLKSGSTNSAG